MTVASVPSSDRVRVRARRLAAVGLAVASLAGVQSITAAPAGAAAEQAADLSVAVSHTPGSPFTGKPVTFTVTASNAGPGPAAAVVAGLTLGYTFRITPTPTPTWPSCRLGSENQAVVCSLGTIPAGGSVSVSITATAYTAGVYSLPVAVSSETPDPDVADRASTDTIIVQQGPTQLELAVGGIYELVLGRPATGAEASYWATALTQSFYERRHRIPLAIISGAESRRRRVGEAYQRLLGRPASAADVAYWSGRLGAGLVYERFEVALIGSREFANRQSGTDATLQAVFRAVLGRSARAAELADWRARHARGARIGQIAGALSTSTEGRDRVMRIRFDQSLGHPPTDFDRFFWFSSLNQGSTADIEWAKVLVSQNYLSQFPSDYPAPYPVY